MAIKYLLFSGILFYVSCAEGQVIGDSCRYDNDCFVEQSYCLRQEMCECKENFVVSDDFRYCLATVGAVCYSSHDCSSLPNSECKEGACLCRRDFVPDPHNIDCKPAAQGLNKSCEFDVQCQVVMGDFATCKQGHCVCLPNYHFHLTCIRSRSLGDTCTNKTDCFGQFMVCSADHRCMCQPGYRPTTQGTCRSAGVSHGIITWLLLFGVIFIMFSHIR